MSQMVPQSNLSLSAGFDLESALDSDNPRSLLNILPSSVTQYLKAIPSNLTEMSIEELRKAAIGKHGSAEMLDMLRTAWWVEYNRAQRTKTNFKLANVFNGLVGAKGFHNDWISNSFRLLYIITPPVDYQVNQHRILEMAFAQEMKILSMPVMKMKYDKEGNPIGEEIDSKLLSVQQKIGESIRNRVLGMPVQRSMQYNQNHNFNMGAPSGGATANISEMSQEELQEYVDRMTRERHGEEIDVEPKQKG